MSDEEVFFKISIPLIAFGIILAGIGESYFTPLFWVGFALMLTGIIIGFIAHPS